MVIVINTKGNIIFRWWTMFSMNVTMNMMIILETLQLLPISWYKMHWLSKKYIDSNLENWEDIINKTPLKPFVRISYKIPTFTTNTNSVNTNSSNINSSSKNAAIISISPIIWHQMITKKIRKLIRKMKSTSNYFKNVPTVVLESNSKIWIDVKLINMIIYHICTNIHK